MKVKDFCCSTQKVLFKQKEKKKEKRKKKKEKKRETPQKIKTLKPLLLKPLATRFRPLLFFFLFFF